MSEKNNHIDKLFHRKLSDYEHPVRAGAWNGIEKDLAQKRTSKKKLIFSGITAAASIMLLIGIGVFLSPSKQDNSVSIADSKKITHTKENSTLNNNVTTNEITRENDIIETTTPNPERDVLKRTTSYSESYIQQEKPEINDEEETQLVEKTSSTANNNAETEMPIISQEIQIKEEKNNTFRLPVKEQAKNRWLSLALALSNVSSLTSNNTSTYMFAQNFAIENDYLAAEKYEHINTVEMKHKQPFSVGLSVRKQFTNRWAIESGLVYTRLSSTEIHKIEDRIIMQKDIDLDYLGIPIKGVFSFYSTKRLSVYVTAGGMIEKNIAGKEHSDNSQSTSVSVKQIQCSLLGNVGIDYRFIDNLSVFFEPGVGYFFDDGSDIETIRKDTPFNYNLQGGIRYTFK